MTNSKPAGECSPHADDMHGATGSGCVPAKTQLRAATPEAVLAVVPHMLGFYPSRSLVVLGLGQQSRVMVTFRYDLPDPFDYELGTDIAGHAAYVLGREQICSALLVGYGPEELVLPVLAMTTARLGSDGIGLQEVLHADRGRYWSLLCDDASCCPPEGRPYDPGSHPAAAVMSEAGLIAQPDREALARTIQRPAGAADAVARATQQARLRLARVTERGEAAGDRDPGLRVTRIGRKQTQQAIRLYRSGGSIQSIEHLGWLAVLLADIRVRDDAWARMDPAHRDDHCRLWTDVVRGAALDFVPAPASLLAFTAWQAGNGAVAAMAVERALAADPDYSMAHLLDAAIQAALPPAAARMPMTPAAVAASYAPRSVAEPGRKPDARRVPRQRPSRAPRKGRGGGSIGAGSTGAGPARGGGSTGAGSARGGGSTSAGSARGAGSGGGGRGRRTRLTG